MAIEAATTGAPARSLWHNRDFLLLWSGQGISSLGNAISTLALPLLVLALTNSPAQAGFVGAAGVLPYVILALPAGALVDRWDRRAVMMICDLARALALCSVPLAVRLGRLTLAQISLVAVIMGAALVFFNIAHAATLARIVPAPQLPQATAWERAADSTAALLGPGVSGLIISLARTTVAGTALALRVDGLSFLISALSLRFIRAPFQVERTDVARSTLRSDIAEGLHFLWTHRRIRALAFVSMTGTFVYSPLALAVIVLAQQHFAAGARQIGLLFSIGGCGALLGALLAPSIIGRVRVGAVICGVMAGEALASALLAAADSPPLLIIGWAIISIIGPVYSVTVLSYRLTLVPDALQGRVTSVFRLLNLAGQPLGLAAGGALLTGLGPRPVLWAMASGGLVIVLIAGRAAWRWD